MPTTKLTEPPNKYETREEYNARKYREQMAYFKKYPWVKILVNIKSRCNNPKSTSFNRYGAKGIKNFLTRDDIKYLWFRDKAYKLLRPSIDRKNSKGHYIVRNCRFIELSINSSNHKRTKIITDKDIFNIRREYATGNFIHKDLAKKYGISRRYVCNIINRTRRTRPYAKSY